MNELFNNKKNFIKLLFILTCFLIIALISSFFMINNNLNSQRNYFKVNTARVLTNSTMLILDKNYTNINNSNISKTLILEIKKIKSHLQVINLKGKVIFDSKIKNVFHKNLKVDINNSLQYDAYFGSKNPNLLRITFPVIKNGTQVANAVFTIPSQLLFKDLIQHNIFIMLLPMILFIVLLILIVIYYIFKISSDIFKPLNSLIKASTEISKGS